MPEVVGKYMRTKVIASLKAVAAQEKENAAAEDEDYEEGVADDLSVCCHGRAAAPEVNQAHCLFILISLYGQKCLEHPTPPAYPVPFQGGKCGRLQK